MATVVKCWRRRISCVPSADLVSAIQVNYLDRTNLNNAYVSGMKEELSFRGNQLNQINTIFTVGYTIGQVPCNIALYYIKPRIFFTSCMVGNPPPPGL